MGLWIEVEEGEPISRAVVRFRAAILAEGAFPLHHCKWHKKRHDRYEKPSVLGRRRRWRTRAIKANAHYGPDPDYWWADDLLLRPRRSLGATGRYVQT